MKHLIINLIIMLTVVIFICYRMIHYLCDLLVRSTVFIGDDDFVKLNPYQLDIFALKKNLLK
jgi:hypothetical protein